MAGNAAERRHGEGSFVGFLSNKNYVSRKTVVVHLGLTFI